MRPTQKMNRSRGKSNRKSHGNISNRTFESAGPVGKVRGTPQQIIEKYQSLARDAALADDRVISENFLQHAEHYTRLLDASNLAMQAAQREAQAQNAQQQNEGGNEDGGDTWRRRPERQPERQAERQPERQAERQPERQAERQPERQAERSAPEGGRKSPAKSSTGMAVAHDNHGDCEAGGLVVTPESLKSEVGAKEAEAEVKPVRRRRAPRKKPVQDAAPEPSSTAEVAE